MFLWRKASKQVSNEPIITPTRKKNKNETPHKDKKNSKALSEKTVSQSFVYYIDSRFFLLPPLKNPSRDPSFLSNQCPRFCFKFIYTWPLICCTRARQSRITRSTSAVCLRIRSVRQPGRCSRPPRCTPLSLCGNNQEHGGKREFKIRSTRACMPLVI